MRNSATIILAYPKLSDALAFDGSQTLYIIIDKMNLHANATLVAFDLATGEASNLSLDLGARSFQIFPLQN